MPIFGQVVELVAPNNPALPKMPDLAPLDRLLARFQNAVDAFFARSQEINFGLVVTGFWIGAVTVAVLWFLFSQYRAATKPKDDTAEK